MAGIEASLEHFFEKAATFITEPCPRATDGTLLPVEGKWPREFRYSNSDPKVRVKAAAERWATLWCLLAKKARDAHDKLKRQLDVEPAASLGKKVLECALVAWPVATWAYEHSSRFSNHRDVGHRDFSPGRVQAMETLVQCLIDAASASTGNDPARINKGIRVIFENAALIQRTNDASLGSDLSQTRHSVDFSSVHWYGVDHVFTESQARVVGILWAAWENRTPHVLHRTILSKAALNNDRLQDVFKKKGKMHAAWGAMIVSSKEAKGTARLQEPV